jgi:hypothetical protein
VAKGSSADLMSQHCQPPPLIVGQSEATAAHLRLQSPVLFAKGVDDIAFSRSSHPSSTTNKRWNGSTQSIRI